MIGPIFITVVAVIAFAFGRASQAWREECPREIMGYNCRGGDSYYGGCDHSEILVLEAKLDMARARQEDEELA